MGSVHRLSYHKIDNRNKYFLDANLWVLRLKTPKSPRNRELKYLKFFESLLESEATIYVHSLLISEIFNRVMRINFENYKSSLKGDPTNKLSDNQINKLSFKKNYRGSDNYLYYFEILKEEFSSYSELVSGLDRDFQVDITALIENIPNDADFNDYFYFKMAEQLKLTIVTDDGDFSYVTIDVLTENRNLLDL